MMYQDAQRGSVHGPYTAGYTGPGGFGSYGSYGSYGADPSGFIALMERRGVSLKPQRAQIMTAEERGRTDPRVRPDLPMTQIRGGSSSPFVDGSSAAGSTIGVLTEGALAATEGSWWPWILGGTAVLAIGGGIAYVASRKKKKTRSQP
jgi:hypothetical protein